MVDIFIPTMMHPFVDRSDASWFRPFAMLKPDVAVEPVRSKLHPISRAFQEQRAKGFESNADQAIIDRFLNQTTLLGTGSSRSLRAAAKLSRFLDCARDVGRSGASDCMRERSKRDGRPGSRTSREMALRVSIGARRWRLVQMALIESAWLGFLSAAPERYSPGGQRRSLLA